MESEDLIQIIVAIKNGDLCSFYKFIQEKSINEQDENGNTLLHIASAKGSENVVAIILSFRPEIEATNSFNWTPIMQAARAGHKNIVEKLIDHGADFRRKNFFGLNLLDLAAASGKVDLVEFLKFLLLSSYTYSIKCGGISSLHIASLFGNYMVVDSLLANEGDPNKVLPSQGITPLICAAASGDITTVELLVVKGIRLLMLAAYEGNIKKEELLPLVNVGVCGVGFRGDFIAQDVASFSNNNNIKEFLDMFRHHLNEEESGFISNFFMSLLEEDLEELKKLCQNKPATAQCAISLGITPLMLAVMFGQIEVVQLLLSFNADVNAADHIKGWTPIIYSLFHKNPEITLLLHKFDANIHAKGFDGISALDLVSYQSDERIFELFSCKNLKVFQTDEAALIDYNHDVLAKLNRLEVHAIKRQSDPLSARRRNPMGVKRGSSVPNFASINSVVQTNYFAKLFSRYESLPVNVRGKDHSEFGIKNGKKVGRQSVPDLYLSSCSGLRESYVSNTTYPAFEYSGSFQNLSETGNESSQYSNIDEIMLKLGHRRISDECLQNFKKKSRENNFLLCERIYP